MNDIEFQLNNFMLYCSFENLYRKTLLRANVEGTVREHPSYKRNKDG